MKIAFKQFFDQLFPQPCFLCHTLTNAPLCQTCIQHLPYAPKPALDIQILFTYEYPIPHLIHAIKYQNNLVLLNYLAKLLAQHIQIRQKPDIILPIPLHKARLRQRGYNQTVEIAKVIARDKNIPLDYKHCVKTKSTRQQVGLSKQERQENLRDAFELQTLPPHWQSIVILDDVVTTGSTINEFARTLLKADKNHQIKRIEVWACAAVISNLINIKT